MCVFQVVWGEGDRVEVHKQPEVFGGECARQGQRAQLQDHVHRWGDHPSIQLFTCHPSIPSISSTMMHLRWWSWKSQSHCQQKRSKLKIFPLCCLTRPRERRRNVRIAATTRTSQWTWRKSARIVGAGNVAAKRSQTTRLKDPETFHSHKNWDKKKL